MKNIFWSLPTALLVACSTPTVHNAAELTDGNPSTSYSVSGHKLEVLLDGFSQPMKSYKVYSSGEKPACDPQSWVLYGSKDGKNWVALDRKAEVKYCSRYQEQFGEISNSDAYTSYKFEIEGGCCAEKLAIGEISFFEENTEPQWRDFAYPKVDFQIQTPETQGEKIYRDLVQDPQAYVRYHTRKVAEILFYTAADTMNTVGQIDYFLKEYDGVSAKSGNPAQTQIVYSTKHIERSAQESMYKLDYETRGVLYHELVHAYQFEPKGIGTYGTNKEFWACIEGLADAVRAHAGLFDFKTMRKAGGHWMDGYKTTGFFIEWLTTKDPDAIRKFHLTVRDMEKWSFEAAIQQVCNRPIQEVWDEYQSFLKTEAAPSI